VAGFPRSIGDQRWRVWTCCREDPSGQGRDKWRPEHMGLDGRWGLLGLVYGKGRHRELSEVHGVGLASGDHGMSSMTMRSRRQEH
jgi:hypothetical protein